MKDGASDRMYRYAIDSTLDGTPVIRDLTVSEVMATRNEKVAAEDPLTGVIKEFLDGRPEATYDLGNLIDELAGKISYGIKDPRSYIGSLVADGQLEGYAIKRGDGTGARYIFKKGGILSPTDFIRDLLKEGRLASANIKTRAQAHGYSWTAIERAKKGMADVHAFQDQQVWYWELRQSF
jgi:hypothetical protein